jgi:hypothetical protein
MGAKHFGDLTHWDKSHADGNHGEAAGGWYRPGENYFISPQDPCWNRVLDQARTTYGDPGIHFDTDNPWQERHLVFGDGTRLPADGALVYHDAATKRTWAQNDDGTVSLVGPDGNPGAPRTPVGYRKVGDRYAPVDEHGDQIGPQLGGVPGSENGFHADPQTGALTPKNSNGDYYTLGPDGRKSFFDKSGAPITEDQFEHSSARRDGGGQQPPAAGLPTDEQQSGQAAEALKKLHRQLKDRYTALSDAEEKLSEVLLNAHATTAAGQKKLHDIQGKLVAAVDNPALAMDTAAGERAFLTLLRNQVGDINDLLTAGSLRAEDQSKTIAALSALYTADSGAGRPTDPATPWSDSLPPAGGTPDPELPADPGPASTDAGLDPAPQVADPGLSDLSGGALPVAAESLSPLASMLPAAGGLGSGAGVSPLDGLSPLLGSATPLAGGNGQPGEHASRDRSADGDDDSTEPAQGKASKAATARNDAAVAPAGGQQSGGDAPTAGGQPPVPAVAPAAASTTVTLPDGSTSVARNPQAAQAIRDYLAGDTVDASYRKNGIALPAPGTALTHPVDPNHLVCGDLAMFKDHYVPVLSAVKAFLNGQVVPLGSVTSSPDFLGWIDPSAAAAVSAAPGLGPAAGVSAPAPTPAAGVPAAVAGG